MLKNNCAGGVIEFSPNWLSIYGTVDLANPTIIDSTKKAGALYSGSFEVYNAKKHCVETVYIKEVIYNKPATIVLWSDGTKTVTKCDKEDKYSEEIGLIYCIVKKLSSNSIDKLFSEWIPNQQQIIPGPIHVTLKDIRANSK